MAKKNFGDYNYDDETPIESILKDFQGFADTKARQTLQAKYDEKFANEKAKWDLTRTNEKFADTITDESNRKIVLKMLNTGTTIDEIKKDFAQLLPSPDKVIKVNPTPNTNTSDVLQFMQGQKETEIESLLNKPLAELNQQEFMQVAQYNASQKLKEK